MAEYGTGGENGGSATVVTAHAASREPGLIVSPSFGTATALPAIPSTNGKRANNLGFIETSDD
jgi:hypothetical protein